MTTTLERTPLEVSALAPEAQRALANPMTKLMAARGLAPIPNPKDLIAVLYQLALEPDEKLRGAAEKSASELPPPILRAGLADTQQDARVLDFFAGRLTGAAELLEVIVRNQRTHPATIARLAGRGAEGLCDLIADNQERLLANPDIISALYANRAARMSTVDRIVELAVRRGVKVAGIATWDELVKVYTGADRAVDKVPATKGTAGEMVEVDEAALDQMFASAVDQNAAQPDNAEVEIAAQPPEQAKEVWMLPVPVKLRLALLGNAFDRAILIRDPKKIVATAVIKSPGVTEIEAAKYASNNGLNEEVIAFIAKKREWTKLYNIKMALVNNPKCPLPEAMRLLPLLREKDIQAVSRSKGIPSALAAQARKLMQARASGNKG